mmetsp:Transcript_6027/g.14655  ORF Transcript_6027/g.14655 Transcript_6027/m.14655 type:complete len:448 (-) Transcript_6027:320-1663(-)
MTTPRLDKGGCFVIWPDSEVTLILRAFGRPDMLDGRDWFVGTRQPLTLHTMIELALSLGDRPITSLPAELITALSRYEPVSQYVSPDICVSLLAWHLNWGQRNGGVSTQHTCHLYAWSGDGESDQSCSMTPLIHAVDQHRMAVISHENEGRSAAGIHAAFRPVVQWLLRNGAKVGKVGLFPPTTQCELLARALEFLPEASINDMVSSLIGTSHGPFRPHEGRGVGLAWLALHYDHLSAAQALILAGAGLETTDNLLYSELDSPACDRICPWLDEQLACRHAFITAILGGIIQEHPPSTSPANRPNKLTRLRGHSDVITLIASFVGVKSGATPRRLRQARDILHPVLHNRYTWNSRASRAFLLVTEALTLGSSEGLPRSAGNPTSARLYHEFWQARNPRQSGRELLRKLLARESLYERLLGDAHRFITHQDLSGLRTRWHPLPFFPLD